MSHKNLILKDMNPIKVIGQELRTNNARMEEIKKFWDKFLKEKALHKIQHQINQDTIIAVYTDYDSDESGDYTLILGAPVSSLEHIPSGMIGFEIPKATYAIVTTHGTIPESIMSAWQYIWSDQFPYKRAYLYDFELYTPEQMTQPSPKVDIFISIHQDKKPSYVLQ